MSEIQWVRHGRAPTVRAQEELVRGPLMQRVADRRQRVGIAHSRGLKGEADGVGQVGEGREPAVGTRETCR